MHRIMPYTMALALIALPALADENKTLDPVELSKQTKGPPPQLSDEQRGKIQQALDTENTEQKTPPNFQPQVGATLPGTMTVDVMPPKLVEQDRALAPYGYAKLAKELLIVDPTKKTIVAILPRQDPSSGKDLAPADWAKTKGRELTGQAPERPAAQDHSPEPAGDSGDKKNGNEKNANEK